jgi:hydrophobe/amphiphile efflux-3 (HAE3) family protein
MNLRPLAKILVQHPKIVILLYTIITIAIGTQATHIYMESNLATFLPSDDPTVQLWNKIDENFQLGSTIIIYVEANDIRDPNVLKEMDQVSSNPKVNAYENDQGKQDGIFSVKSLASYIKAENAKPPLIGGLGGTGLNEIPDDEALIARYMSRTMVQAMKGTLYTNTYKVAVIILQLSLDADVDAVLERTKDAVEHRGTYYTEMTVTGTIPMQYAIQQSSMEYFQIIFPTALILVSLVIFIFHRSAKGILIALFPTAYSILLTFGVMGMIVPQLTLLSIAIVALLLGLGVDYSIHMMNRFAEERSIEDNIDRTEKILSSTGKAILLSTVTTIIGFASLMISSMTPIVTFGFGCALGISFCFISTVILTPSLSIILKYEKAEGPSSWKKFATWVINNRMRIIAIACFFAVVSIILLPETKTDVNYFDLAPEGIPELEKLKEYSDTFGGANFNALLLETDPQGLTYPETIDALYNMQERLRNAGIDAYSIADVIKEINDVVQRDEIIEKLSEYVGVDTIIFDMVATEGYINKDFSKTIILIYIPLGISMAETQEMVNTVNKIASEANIPHNGHVSILTGQDAINVAINEQLSDQQTRSMIIAILLVLASLIIIFSSSIYGFLTMIPIAFVLMWEPGFLVALDIPLSVVTISIASIMIGIGIDYGVHITHRIREEMSNGSHKEQAIKKAIERTGLSLMEAASTTIAGVAAILVIDIAALQQFALVIVLMVALSCIGAAVILPAFFKSRFIK